MGLVAQNAKVVFVCPNCGEHYKVTPQYIGRYVRCWCGATIGVPAYTQQAKSTSKTIPSQEVEKVSADLEAQLLRPCPRCRYLLEPKVMICMHCGYDRESGRVLHTTVDATTPSLTAEQIEERWQRSWAGRILRWKSWQIPLALVLVSYYLLFILWSFAVTHLGEVDFEFWDLLKRVIVEGSIIFVIFFLIDFGSDSIWAQWLKAVSVVAVVAVFQMVVYWFLGETVNYFLSGGGIFIIKLIVYDLMIQWYYDSDSVEAFALIGVLIAICLTDFVLNMPQIL